MLRLLREAVETVDARMIFVSRFVARPSNAGHAAHSTEIKMRSFKPFRLLTACLAVGVTMCVGCGRLPLVSENREGFAPWERFPPQAGFRYLDTYVHDAGHDPTYLALIDFDSDADLQKIVREFDLEESTATEPEISFATLKSPPKWFNEKHCTKLFVCPACKQTRCAINLWVDTSRNIAVLERSWF